MEGKRNLLKLWGICIIWIIKKCYNGRGCHPTICIGVYEECMFVQISLLIFSTVNSYPILSGLNIINLNTTPAQCYNTYTWSFASCLRDLNVNYSPSLLHHVNSFWFLLSIDFNKTICNEEDLCILNMWS